MMIEFVIDSTDLIDKVMDCSVDLVSASNTQEKALSVLQRFRVIFRAAQQHSASIEAMLGVSGAQAWVLAELSSAGPMRAGELAARLAIKPATLSNMLAKLVSADLVTRVRSEQDMRVVQVALSSKGAALIGKVDVAPRGWLPEALSRLENDQLESLAASLDGLLAVMDKTDIEDASRPLPFTE